MAISRGPGLPEKSVTMGKLAGYAINKLYAPISVKGQWADDIPENWDIKTEFVKNVRSFAFATQSCEVEIDEGTGEVKVLKFVAAHETGTTMNEMLAEGQIEGAVMQGIGFTFMESMTHDNGRVVNDNFLDYKLPTFGEQPEIDVQLIETGDPHGPYGAKGIGEAGLVPTAAALANAVYDASGIRVRELPITREFILNALKKRSS
jgi:CO/xanthine dehydrogenase Mo-binding subunit